MLPGAKSFEDTTESALSSFQAYVEERQEKQVYDDCPRVGLGLVLDARQQPCLVALRMYAAGKGNVWDRVGRPHRDCMCYLGPPTTLMPM